MALVRQGCSRINAPAPSQTDPLEGGRPEGGDRHGYQHRFRPAFPTGAHARQRVWAFRGNGSCHNQQGPRTDPLPGGRPERQRANYGYRSRPACPSRHPGGSGGAAWATAGAGHCLRKMNRPPSNHALCVSNFAVNVTFYGYSENCRDHLGPNGEDVVHALTVRSRMGLNILRVQSRPVCARMGSCIIDEPDFLIRANVSNNNRQTPAFLLNRRRNDEYTGTVKTGIGVCTE
jgi:hypothetical protein